jgi:hypothetical protein
MEGTEIGRGDEWYSAVWPVAGDGPVLSGSDRGMISKSEFRMNV